MRRLGCLLVMGCALVAAGCGVDLHGGDESVDQVSDAQLAIMVLPRDHLGGAARRLELASDSGSYGNKEGADDTIDPHDSAASLRVAGRLGGYHLHYSSPKALEIWRSGGGYSDVETAVELFDTPSDAAVYLDNQARDFTRFEGKNVGHGVRLASSDVLRITDIGESAWQIRGTVRFGQIVTRGTVIAFRRGRIVGSVSIARGDARDITGPTRIIARALDHRIAAVLNGDITAKPVPLPLAPGAGSVQRLKAMVLSIEDLPHGASVESEGRQKSSSDKVVYDRIFSVSGTPVSGSRFLTLRARAELLTKESDARAAVDVLGSKEGRTVVLRSFDRGAHIPGHSSIAPLAGLPAGMVGSVISVRAPKGLFQAFFITLRVENVVETLTAFGAADEVDAAGLTALAVKARARLESAL